MRVIVTGGAGFIGSAVVRRLVAENVEVLNLDKLTYAGDLRTVAMVASAQNYRFVHCDVADQATVSAVFADFRPTAVIHLAAESHVDRSIDHPAEFLQTNIVGTFVMLEEALRHAETLGTSRSSFRFVLVSTDEVYGSLGAAQQFTEEMAYAPNSPYAASKASADLLARAWHRTYGLPTIITNCSNNYGPYQNAEKFIPTIVRSAVNGYTIPIYGTGSNVRDWLFVDDHVNGLLAALTHGQPGEKYNFGGNCEISNLDLAKLIVSELDRRVPRGDGIGHAELVTFVRDRPGHDFRYAIDSSKSNKDLGWRPRVSLACGLARTIEWYLGERDWLGSKENAGRLGLNRSKEA